MRGALRVRSRRRAIAFQEVTLGAEDVLLPALGTGDEARHPKLGQPQLELGARHRRLARAYFNLRVRTGKHDVGRREQHRELILPHARDAL